MSSVAEVRNEQAWGSGRGVSSGANVRRANKAQILRHLHDHGPSSRREIAARCGLAVSTLTSLIEELRTSGLVVELEPIRRPCAGRPTRPITISSNDHCVLGLRLDDQAITAVATTLGGAEVWSTTEPVETITPRSATYMTPRTGRRPPVAPTTQPRFEDHQLRDAAIIAEAVLIGESFDWRPPCCWWTLVHA